MYISWWFHLGSKAASTANLARKKDTETILNSKRLYGRFHYIEPILQIQPIPCCPISNAVKRLAKAGRYDGEISLQANCSICLLFFHGTAGGMYWLKTAPHGSSMRLLIAVCEANKLWESDSKSMWVICFRGYITAPNSPMFDLPKIFAVRPYENSSNG